ncbi:aspartate racemase [Rahnella sp. AA]|uniref:aspartate/glutamate racemase family protein n=1 Tax=Rahnella sp. AA TaxID=2057180 RepID=UPI000C345E02|nr:amino acid racemase [Rahnella sp. AA]PKE28606.1 aspartate racemase [Rahnella sp. AA]
MTEFRRLGILGGMGPLATLDFQQKILAATAAQRDQDHVPVVVWNVPQIADRQQALAGNGPSPLPQLLEAVKGLNQAGASHIAIPCNTAHYWYNELAAASAAPLLHIADITAQTILEASFRPQAVGLIATQGTLDAGWYQARFSQAGIRVVIPTSDELARWFVPGCYAVKRGDLRGGGQLLNLLADKLIARGAQKLVLACTEVPPALGSVGSRHLSDSIDPGAALANVCVRMWHQSHAAF